MPKAKAPIVVAVTSDHHIGSTIGLLNPKTPLDDGGSYMASLGQRWLWRHWNQFCTAAIDTATTWKAPLIAVFNGDLIETDFKLRSDQIVTRNRATLLRMVQEVMRPLVDYSEQVYIVRGTEAHTGKSGEYESMIGQDLTNAVPADEKNSVYSWWHLEMDVNGVTFDIAHHGKLGMLPWTKANGAHSLAGQLIIEYAEEGLKPPAVAIRSHLHRYADTGANFETVRLFATPAWQLATAYVHRAVRGRKRADIGGLIFTCWPDGRYDVEVARYRPPRRRPHRVKI
jgi:hypothetical protein